MSTPSSVQESQRFDDGTQPEDINAIGVTASRFPVRLMVFFVVLALIFVVVAYFTGKHFLSSFWASREPGQKSEVQTGPTQGVGSSPNRPKLPGANTPLEPSSLPDVQAPQGIPNATTNDLQPKQRQGAPADCASTALIDKRTGQSVKDAQGRSVMVDCKGVIQSAALVPAPQGGANAAAPGTNTAGASTPMDRYSGDTSLAPKKSAAVSLLPTNPIPPPPVSSADLEERFKRILAPAAANPAPNAILTTPSSGNANPPNPQGSMGGLLSPTSTPKAMAAKTFDPSLTVPKGDAIDCAMTTRVVTEISGFTSCVVSDHVYSANGKVLLIERMSEIQGEYTAVGQPGQRRVYVLWSRIRKPGGITIDIASPSTDSLGAAGIDGIVDNRWFERIGSAYMLSIFKDFLAANTASAAGGAAGVSTPTGAALYQNSINTSTSLAEKVLAQSINIKPVVYAHQGERVSIYVARDLDFSSIYQVKPTQKP
jgi:type IV secretion system protein VirB10